MDLHRLAASVVVAGFDGASPTREVRELGGQGLCGCILFKRNVGTAIEVASLCAHGGGMPAPIRSIIRHFPDELGLQ